MHHCVYNVFINQESQPINKQQKLLGDVLGKLEQNLYFSLKVEKEIKIVGRNESVWFGTNNLQ